jgi:ferredoxin-NADP reductase
MKYIDSFLNSITMYRLTLYYLIGLVVAAVFLSFFGLISYNPLDIILDSLLAVIVCYVANFILAKLFHAVTNYESVFITALILTLIIPVAFSQNIFFLIIASVVAMASKYFLTVEKKHIFNPAAVSVAGISLLSRFSATWWVGTEYMLPFVLIGGLLVMRKIRREDLIITFLISVFVLLGISRFITFGTVASILNVWERSVLDSALFFFAFVMLVEPLTIPATKNLQRIYAGFVAILYTTPQIGILPIVFTPEISLVIGNIFTYFSSPQYRLLLPLQSREAVSPDTYTFTFTTPNALRFKPGQYMEWTLPHEKSDSRGNRRYFSIASSPTRKDLMMAVKFYNPSSTFKKTLMDLQKGDTIVAAQVTGDFVLPKDLSKPLVFLAGGVGIAPFRSMIEYIIDKKLQVDIVVLFSNKTEKDILFQDLLEKGKPFGVKTIYSVSNPSQSWKGESGRVTEKMIAKEIPDYQLRTFYISGPQLMVQNLDSLLRSMHIPRKQIITDYFPGYSEK